MLRSPQQSVEAPVLSTNLNPSGPTYQNIQISGNARVLLGNSIGHGSETTVRADYVGQYAHSSLRPVTNYVPRPTLQRQIKEQLHDAREAGAIDTRTLVVYGLGGSGKSQLVLYYIQEYRQDYTAVFWIEAGQKETLERDYLQIYRLLLGGLTTAAESVKLDDAVPAVKSWFYRQSGRSLVVLDSADTIDNADDPSYIDLEYFRPDGPLVDVIVTTRSSRSGEMSSLVAVEVAAMEAGEAATLFQKCAKLHPTAMEIVKEVGNIVSELGYLALAITLAGSYVAATPRLSSDLRLYLPEYRERRKELLSAKATKHVHRYRESVLGTWETSFAAVEQQSAVASRLFTLLAFLNFDDIFLDLFSPKTRVGEETMTKARVGGPRWQIFVSPEAVFDRYAVESAFAVLQTYSLVQWRGDQVAYAMHKLVHAWGCDRLKINEKRELSLTMLELLIDFIGTCRGDLTRELRLVPHIMANFGMLDTVYKSSHGLDDVNLELVAVAGDFLRRMGRWEHEHKVRIFHLRNVSEVAGGQHPSLVASMNNLAAVLSHQGKYEQAEEIYRETLRRVETVLGKEHPSTLASINNLAAVLSHQGKYQQAEEIYRQILRLSETVLGKEHPFTLASMNNLVEVLSHQGKYERAEVRHRQTLRLRETVLGKEHPDTLVSMNNLAEVLSHQGKYEQAEKIHRQTVRLSETVLGKEHPSTLASMNNLATVLNHQGKYERAEEIHRQTVRLRETVLGKEHPDTLVSMNNLAEVLSHQGKYEQAEKIYRQTVRLKEMMLGKEHPSTLVSMNNLAAVLSHQGKYQQAEEIHRQTLRLSETVLGKEHPDTLASMNNLATVLSHQGKYEQAEKISRQTVRLSETVLGKEHPDTLVSMNNLATVLGHQGKYEQAEEIHRQTVRLRETVLGKEHPSTLVSMNNLATVLGHQSKYEQAEKIHRQTVRLRETVLGKEHPSTLVSMNNLAVVLSYQGKYEQAEGIYRQTSRLSETVLGKEHPDTLSSMNNLASILWNQGHLVEAAELEVRILLTRTTLLGPEHPDTLVSMVNLAHMWKSQRRDADAVDLMKQGVRLQGEKLGLGHPRAIQSAQTLHEWLTSAQTQNSDLRSNATLSQ